MTERAYSVPMLAKRWGCSPGHIRNLIDRGHVRAFSIGRLIRIPGDEVGRIECNQNIPSSDCAGDSQSSGTTQTKNDTAINLPRAIDLGPRLRHDAGSQPGVVLDGRWPG